jgi:mannosyl-3-phosphoglycerate phosphatase
MQSTNSQKREKRRFVVFTDMDDTLLDENYDYHEALPVLRALQEKKTPVIFCSAKTYGEQQVYRKKMGLMCPFIVENGSAIYIPAGYFGEAKGRPMGDYEVLVLGIPSEQIKREIRSLKERFAIKSYCTMTVEEVAGQMNLDLESAKLARDRQFTETIIEADQEALDILGRKFSLTFGGRAIEAAGKGADKGRAVKLLTDMYGESGAVVTDGRWVELAIPGLRKAEGVGPKGWSRFLRQLVLGGANESN